MGRRARRRRRSGLHGRTWDPRSWDSFVAAVRAGDQPSDLHALIERGLVVPVGGGQHIALPVTLDGMALTHVLTAADLAADMVAAEPDLCPLQDPVLASVGVAGGGRITFASRDAVEDGPPRDPRPAVPRRGARGLRARRRPGRPADRGQAQGRDAARATGDRRGPRRAARRGHPADARLDRGTGAGAVRPRGGLVPARGRPRRAPGRGGATRRPVRRGRPALPRQLRRRAGRRPVGVRRAARGRRVDVRDVVASARLSTAHADALRRLDRAVVRWRIGAEPPWGDEALELCMALRTIDPGLLLVVRGHEPALAELAAHLVETPDAPAAVLHGLRAAAHDWRGEVPAAERALRLAAAAPKPPAQVSELRAELGAYARAGAGPLATWVWRKAAAWLHGIPRLRPLRRVAQRLFVAADPQTMGDPVVTDVALFEHGLFERFLAECGSCLPAAERGARDRLGGRPAAALPRPSRPAVAAAAAGGRRVRCGDGGRASARAVPRCGGRPRVRSAAARRTPSADALAGRVVRDRRRRGRVSGAGAHRRPWPGPHGPVGRPRPLPRRRRPAATLTVAQGARSARRRSRRSSCSTCTSSSARAAPRAGSHDASTGAPRSRSPPRAAAAT